MPDHDKLTDHFLHYPEQQFQINELKLIDSVDEQNSVIEKLELFDLKNKHDG